MELYTQQAILDFWDSKLTPEARLEQAEMEQLEKDLETARKYILDAIARYRRDKTRSRSEAKGADPWADLADYTSREQIRDAYGWGMISEAEMDRLMHLWDLREESKSKTVLEDRVVEILKRAVRGVSDPYDEQLSAWDERQARRKKEAARIAAENFERRKL